MRWKSNRSRGFTLAELLAVIAVISISAAIAVPSLGSLVRDSRQTSATNQLVGSLHAARSAAVTRNQSVALCASGGTQSCGGLNWESGWISFVDVNGDGQRQADEDVLETAPATPGITISALNAPNAVTFAGAGRLAAGSEQSRFVLCDSRGVDPLRGVRINSIGQPRLIAASAPGANIHCPTR